MSARTDATASPPRRDDPDRRRRSARRGEFYSDALARGGFRIEQAHNGHQALEKALESLPDLILTDIAVPGLDGIELCRRLRADPRTRAIPLLAITGYGDRHYPDRAAARRAPTDVLLQAVRRRAAGPRRRAAS